MSYKGPLSIRDVIQKIDEKKYLLPSIQREFVWNASQIEKLFDSLMLEYPISTFLFWEVPKEKIHDFKFYEFLREYHQTDKKHNPPANLDGFGDITAILDGQQRMTSLYIGLKGTYAYKLAYRRWDDPTAYPKRKLYLNLLEGSPNEGMSYDFRFLSDDELKKFDKDFEKTQERHYFWFPVGHILNMNESGEAYDYLTDNDLFEFPNKEQKLFARKAIIRLFDAINKNGTISYYLEKSTELDKVLNIFIRVNSGGTALSYSDLLLSFAIAQWEKLDAREEINSLIDNLNKIGNGFNISKDMVLKSCLVLGKVSDIRFKVDNFNRKNMLEIEKNWGSISNSMRLAVELVASFGFSRDNISSNYALIPIAYYMQSIDNVDRFIDSSQYDEDRQRIKKWFTYSILLNVFSFSPDGVLKPIRDIIDKNKNSGMFPLDEIIERFKGTNRDLTFNEDSIQNLLNTKYGSGDTLIVLSILYPMLNLQNKFHIDHIFPKSKFTQKQLSDKGITDEKINDVYLKNVDRLGNLQLLKPIPNQKKMIWILKSGLTKLIAIHLNGKII